MRISKLIVSLIVTTCYKMLQNRLFGVFCNTLLRINTLLKHLNTYIIACYTCNSCNTEIYASYGGEFFSVDNL
jgi:hypothetical protein